MNKYLLIVMLLLLTGIGYPNGSAFEEGMTYYKQMKYLKAIGAFRKASENDATDAQPYLYLGNAYLLLKNDSQNKAIQNYQKALKLATNTDFKAQVYYNMGQAYFPLKEYSNAIINFENAYQLNSGIVNVYQLKGAAYFRMQNKENTIKEWETFLTLVPTGKKSDKIREILAMMKKEDFKFPKMDDDGKTGGKDGKSGTDGGKDGKSGTDGGKNGKDEDIINIDGVLDSVKPSDKGKAEDSTLEDIEM